MLSRVRLQAPWLQKWDLLTLLCLVFTAVVAPVEVAFMETRFNALFVINRIVDVIFILVRAPLQLPACG